MNKQKNASGLTYQDGKGYKKCIGWYEHADGRRLPKIHWLGHNESHARYLAFSLQKAWAIIQADGPRGWTPQDIANVKAFVAQGADMMNAAMKHVADQRQKLDDQETTIQEASFVLPVAAADTTPTALPSESTAAKPASLYGAIESFLKAVRARPVSDSHKQRTTEILEINLKNARKDCPVDDIDYVWLESLANHFRTLCDHQMVTPCDHRR